MDVSQKRNDLIKLIENKMNIDFNKFKMIGYIEDLFYNIIICKYNNEIFGITIDQNDVKLITKFKNIGLKNNNNFYFFTFNDKNYYYEIEKEIYIESDFKNERYITFKNNDECLMRVIKNINTELKLDDTIKTMLKITEYFLDEDEILN